MDETSWFQAIRPQLLWESLLQTLYMVGIAEAIAILLGVPLGVFLATSRRGELFAAPPVNMAIGLLVNAFRSVPFIILVVAILPFTRWVIGTSIGTNAAIVPLVVAAVPFVARIAEGAIRQVEAGLVEAALAMGATPLQVVRKVLLPESLPPMLLGLTLSTVSLIGFSAMVGFVGGKGLGDVGIRYGYQRYEEAVMIAVVAVLIVLVQAVQSAGEALARRVDRRARVRG